MSRLTTTKKYCELKKRRFVVDLPFTYWKNINICFLFIGKYLVVSRNGHEIVDFLNPNAKYELLANNVPRVCGATGGLLQNSPIVCGG